MVKLECVVLSEYYKDGQFTVRSRSMYPRLTCVHLLFHLLYMYFSLSVEFKGQLVVTMLNCTLQ